MNPPVDESLSKDASKVAELTSCEEQPAPDRLLEKFGYVQEMRRTRTTFNLVLMLLVLGSPPYGLATTFFYTLGNGGPLVAVYDWIIVVVANLCVAVSLGEIASLYPVSGGVYYWTYMLTPPRFKPVVSWIVGWLMVVGNLTVSLAVNFATAQLILSAVIIFVPDYVPKPFHTVLTCFAIILVLGVIALVGQRYLHHVDTFSLVVSVAVVLAVLITLPVKAAAGRRSAKFVFADIMDMGAGWPRGVQWLLGFIQGSYCFCGTGMLAAMAEETIRPEVTLPHSMLAGVSAQGVFGLLFLLPIMFTLGDLSTILASPTGQPIIEIFFEAAGTSGAAFGLFLPILLIGLCCGLACSQATSRSIWAFARDGGIPGKEVFGRTSRRLEMPVNAFLLQAGLQCALACIYFGSTAAFNSFVGVSVICLGGSILVPVLMSLVDRRRQVSHSPFYKGKLGAFCSWVTVGWYALLIPLLSFPSYLPVTQENMNYAAVVFVGFAALAMVWYAIYGRTHYQGPPNGHVAL